MEYLEETHPSPPLLPREAVARAKVRELVELVNSGIQPLQNLSVLNHVASLGGDSREWARHYILKGLVALETRTRETRGAFLLGDPPTLADVCLVPQMFNARHLEVDTGAIAPLVDIDARCQGLPRWDRAHPQAQPDAPSAR
jgi:maleylpyruvate isomerase